MTTWMMWFGGSGHASPDYDDMEEFPSTQAAVAAFRSRADHNPYFPCVGTTPPDDGGPCAWLFFGKKPFADGNLYPEAVLQFGPHGGVICTKV